MNNSISTFKLQSYRKGGVFDPPKQENDMARMYFEMEKNELKRTKSLVSKAIAYPLSKRGDANKIVSPSFNTMYPR